ncbi:putative gpi anchored serine-threonine rich protein [Rosellinia necatrix]|uniref:Putative gpi anchored serine-threonine rich protein n=1 Tax=Rosellinia necatrix TaxID=77044 RepID=A0A1W2TRR7_ROSNE|nr:putative gpi anchored serine-threonine rich protein [Rosellinia necatrix]
MRSVAAVSNVLAFAAPALAQVLEPTPWYPYIYFPQENAVIGVGTTYNIAWDAREQVGPATLYLLGGDDSATLRVLSTIASVDVNNAEYKWPVDCSLGEEKTYLIKIASDLDNGETFGISATFHINGPGCHGSYTGPNGYPPKPPNSYPGQPTTSYPARPTSYLGQPISYSVRPTSYPARPTSYLSEPASYQSEPAGYPAAYADSSEPAVVTTTVLYSSGAVIIPSGISSSSSSSSSGGVPAGGQGNSTTTSATLPIPTAGASRAGAGAGLALGLFAGALAL